MDLGLLERWCSGGGRDQSTVSPSDHSGCVDEAFGKE